MTRAGALLSNRYVRWGLLALVVVALLPYLGTLTYGYVYDDQGIIQTNAGIHGWHSLLTLWQNPYWPEDKVGDAGLYRPVIHFIYSVLWNFGDGSPLLFHLANIGAHVVAVLGVWALLVEALPLAGAFAGAAYFAVHPVHVEAVVNLVGLSEICVVLFTYAAVRTVLAARARDAFDWSTALRIGAWYFAALLTKESAAALPGIVALCWWGWRTAPSASDAAAAERPSLLTVVWRGWRIWSACTVLLLATAWLRFLVLGRVVVGNDGAAVGIADVSTAQRVSTMLNVWPLLERLLVWPSQLNAHYGPSIIIPTTGFTPDAQLGVALVVVALLLATWAAVRAGDRRGLTALGVAGLAYLPASNLLTPTGQLLAERTLYLATVGVAMYWAWGLTLVSEALVRLRAQSPLATRLPRSLVAALPGVLLLGVIVPFGMARIATESLAWQSNMTLFVNMIRVDPRNYRGHWVVASDRFARGDTLAGQRELSLAYHGNPHDRQLLIEYLGRLLSAHKFAEAARVADVARRDANAQRRGAGQPFLLLNLAALREGFGPDTLGRVLAARAAGPDGLSVPEWAFWAWTLYQSGKPKDALRAYEHALAAAPGDSTLHFLYAIDLMRAGLADSANRELVRAERLGSVSPAGRYLLRTDIALVRHDTALARHELRLAWSLDSADHHVRDLARRLLPEAHGIPLTLPAGPGAGGQRAAAPSIPSGQLLVGVPAAK